MILTKASGKKDISKKEGSAVDGLSLVLLVRIQRRLNDNARNLRIV